MRTVCCNEELRQNEMSTYDVQRLFFLMLLLDKFPCVIIILSIKSLYLKLLIGGFHSISIKAFCIMQDAFVLFKLFSDCLFVGVI